MIIALVKYKQFTVVIYTYIVFSSLMFQWYDILLACNIYNMQRVLWWMCRIDFKILILKSFD